MVLYYPGWEWDMSDIHLLRTQSVATSSAFENWHWVLDKIESPRELGVGGSTIRSRCLRSRNTFPPRK